MTHDGHPIAHAAMTSTSDSAVHKAAAAESLRLEEALARLDALKAGDPSARRILHETDAAIERAFHAAVQSGGCACRMEGWLRASKAKVLRAARRLLGDVGEHGRVGWQPAAGVALARRKRR